MRGRKSFHVRDMPLEEKDKGRFEAKWKDKADDESVTNADQAIIFSSPLNIKSVLLSS